MYVYVQMNECLESQKQALGPMKRELQVVVNHQTWVLGAKLGFSATAVCAVIH